MIKTDIEILKNIFAVEDTGNFHSSKYHKESLAKLSHDGYIHIYSEFNVVRITRAGEDRLRACDPARDFGSRMAILAR